MYKMDNRKIHTKDLEQYIEDLERIERNRWKDRFLLIAIAIIGISGLLYILKHPYQDPASNDKIAYQNDKPNPADQEVQSYPGVIKDEEPFVINEDSANIGKPIDEAVKTTQTFVKPVDVKATSLQINGNREVFERLDFILDKADPNIKYKLSLGDGRMKYFKGSRVTTSYDKGGNYSVQLHHIQDGTVIKKESYPISILE